MTTLTRLEHLRKTAQSCEDCDLYKNATQTVFGEGSATAGVVFVGEQPGDKEDIAGKPFVGPAGRLLDDAMIAADIRREDVYECKTQSVNSNQYLASTLNGQQMPAK